MNDMSKFLSSLSEEQKNQFLEALLEMKDNESKDRQQKTANVDENFVVKKAESKNNRRREPVRGRENRWKDEGEFRDIETPKVDRVARNRPAHKKAEVECSVCGKPFKVDPKYIYGEYHRCNRCVGR